MSVESRRALALGALALASMAEDSGAFVEYDLPVGPSDQWVTALAGLALAEAGAALESGDRREPSEAASSEAASSEAASSEAASALRAAARAARWLLRNRAAEGWGYNAATGPDADSTAHALLLLHRLGMPAPAECLDWLEARWRPEGGFATYAENSPAAAGPAWLAGHPCVTPPAFLALWLHGRRALTPAFVAYMRRMRQPDGSWPSYWWRGPRHAEFQALFALRITGPPELIPLPNPSVERRYDFSSVHELALILGVEILRHGPSRASEAIAHELARHQSPSGVWPGSPELRVTAPNCHRPWERAEGELHTDAKGLVCTAAALRSLALALARNA